MNASLAARLPLEVLDGVRHVHVRAIDTRFGQCSVEQVARWSDEGPAGEVLLVARLLPHEHDGGLVRALAEDGLGTELPELARPAAQRGRPEGIQISAAGHQR